MPVSHPPPKTFLVEPTKISLYLLNSAHPDGRSKANFFFLWGFDPRRPQDLEAALLDHSRTAVLSDTPSSPWGIKFVYEGTLAAPKGATPAMRTVWEVRTGETVGRLVTAYKVRDHSRTPPP